MATACALWHPPLGSLLALQTLLTCFAPRRFKPFSVFNALLFLASIWTDDPNIQAVSFTSSVATQATFLVAGAWDCTFNSRLRDSFGYTSAVFVIGDLALHCLPTCTLAFKILRSGAAQPRPCFASAYSLFLTLTWALLVSNGTLDLSAVYVPCPPAFWAGLWVVNAAAHLAAGAWLAANF